MCGSEQYKTRLRVVADPGADIQTIGIHRYRHQLNAFLSHHGPDQRKTGIFDPHSLTGMRQSAQD